MADVARHQLPPHSVEAEQALLGSLLIDPAAWPKIASAVKAADFYRNDHRIIFAAIAALQERGRPVDAVIVSERLERQGLIDEGGGLAYIGRLARDTPTAANVETYAAAVKERSTLRRLSGIADRMARAATGPIEQTAAELVADAQQQLHALESDARAGKGLISARELVINLSDDLDKRKDAQIGLRIGLPDFDQLTCGLEPADFVVIAARPGMGKSALMTSIASAVSENVGTAIFSAEMPSMQLMRRCVSLQSNIGQGALRRPEKLSEVEWQEIDAAASAISRRKLWIDETGSPSVSHIRAETLSLKSRSSLGLVLIDYVQLVRAPGSNRYEQLRDVAYSLKALAKELATPIVVLAQLNRGVESREQKRPAISDLRDSGALEEAADVVALLYSQGYYDRTFAMRDVLECEIAKNRNGERGQCLWRFDGAQSRVTMLDADSTLQYRRLISNSNRRGVADL